MGSEGWLPVSSKRSTTFDSSDPRFKKAVKDLVHSAAEVWVDIEDFEDDWKNGMEDAQLMLVTSIKCHRQASARL